MISQKLKTLGLIEQTSETQANNGTRCFYDPIADCNYLSYERGYVRREYTRPSYWSGRLYRVIYQINKTRKYKSEYGDWYNTARIMIPYPSARLERIAHCAVVYRNNLNKN
jgi:hypothetical protein